MFTAASRTGIVAAVAAGLGVSAAATRFVPADFVWNDPPLPPLAAIDCGVYARDGRDRPTLERLADTIADALRPSEGSPAATNAAIAAQPGRNAPR